MAWKFDKILRAARRHLASDIHLIHGVAPAYRVNGEICLLKGEALQAEELSAMLPELLTNDQRETFEREWQLCFSRTWPEIGRCRISVYRHGGIPELSIRMCESVMRSRDDLGLPPVLEELPRMADGLILLTGPTGMGKTTTLNYMVDVINQERRAKIVTIEDPVEFVHENQRSIIVQQEVHTDTPSFRKALVHVLRQDPDVIVVGEMRDLETISTVLTAAETGHLVLATLHTPDCVQTIERIYGVFPPEQQQNIMVQMAASLKAIVAQKLLPRADGEGRVLACEVCVSTPAVRNHIREQNSHQLFNEIQLGGKHKMQTMDNSLMELYQRGDISYDTAISNTRDPDAFREKLSAAPNHERRRVVG